ncbi:N-acetylglucosamine kinase [Neptunicella marina]|uniref:ATPase n=1 Tax=Neptunicella marina TaxID=2125989 RepID=A0A8J6M1Q5_9ALTE|nr:BadF/BadG/BcrA/BcrD ATPase family protein [Neptunicella marina]MBC3765713.1 ATPase [Neptunicella marina]
MVSLSQQLFLGIDGGGSKCKARLENAQGELLGEGLSGPANPLRGIEQTTTSILDATQQALAEAGLNDASLAHIYAGIGLAGVNIPAYRQLVQNWQHPFAQMYVATDLHIACLGAHDGGDGAVIIAGTGSSGVSVIQGEYFEMGGHGFGVGDKGSGAWLGLTAVSKTLEALDDIGISTPLVEKVMQHLQVDCAHTLVEQITGKSPAFFAKLSPVVVEMANQQDPLALSIVRDGADYLNRMARRLLANKPPRFSMIGGVAQHIQKWMDDEVTQRISPTIHPPEIGAILLARSLV